METFCSCGRHSENCGGPGTGHAAVGTTGMPVIVLTDIPAPVDRDQIRVDLRARLKRERNAADRQALARRGRGK